MFDTVENCPWPYVLRRSMRARYLRIKLIKGKPVEVVYPKYSSKREALGFLRDKLTWISQQKDYLESLQNLQHTKSHSVPEDVTFPCINQQWRCIYKVDAARQRTRVVTANSNVIVTGPSESGVEVVVALKRWLKHVAIVNLEPIFQDLSKQFVLPYKQVGWRFQKTRWGSCSSEKKISLNVKLLFLSAAQVRYVMLHELCHTRYLTHGKRFWQLLEEVYPGAMMVDRELYHQDHGSTAWLE